MGCSVALTMTLNRKDRPGLGSVLRSAVPALGSAPQPSAYSGSPASAGMKASSDEVRTTAQFRAKDVIVLEVVATPLILGESVVRRGFKAQIAQDGEDVVPALIRQAAAVNW